MIEDWSNTRARPSEDLENAKAKVLEYYKSLIEKREDLYQQAISNYIGYEVAVENSEDWYKRVSHYTSDVLGTEWLLVDGIKVLTIEMKGLDLYYEFNY